MKKVVATTNAPGAIGPYSQAIVAGDNMYISGQLPINPATGELAEACIKCQTKQSLENIKAILEAEGHRGVSCSCSLRSCKTAKRRSG